MSVSQLFGDRTDNALPTPGRAGLQMPDQNLSERPFAVFEPASISTYLARGVAFGGALALTAVGFQQMLLVFGNETHTPLQIVLLILFTITFGWVAFSTTQALAGLLFGPRRPPDATETGPLETRTAIVMPVYNERPDHTMAALLAMGQGLDRLGHADAFEIFVLSDTRDPDIWLTEVQAFSVLRDGLEGRMRCWYRRRRDNTARKAGNLREFVESWGGRYDHMLVLDADSLMEPGTIAEMARRMEANPRLGILQSPPMLTGGNTIYARIQQFAGALYGPVVARGVAAWQGNDGNYWGHNAMIRTAAFAAHCGLPDLPGRPPFGGHILSHDFVEASLIRRGGWDVRMDLDLGGSYEGAPPTLLDAAARDRRWAQGNLQHARVVPTAGLRIPNRLHFLIGIGSYVLSPLWLAMIVTGLALGAQALLWQPEYFTDPSQLFPDWPIFDSRRMKILFASAIGLLLLPKAIGWAEAMLDHRRRRRFGGGLRLTLNALLELVLSALYAPIMMLIQTRQIMEILLGRDSGWSTQSRDGSGLLRWAPAWERHAGHVAAGLLPLGVLGRYDPGQLIWLSPVLAGLLIAPGLSRYSGLSVHELPGGRHILATPFDRRPPRIAKSQKAALSRFARASEAGLRDLVRDEAARSRHFAISPAPTGTRGGPEPARNGQRPAEEIARITAAAKIDASATLDEALAMLEKQEKLAVLACPRLVSRLCRADRRQRLMSSRA